MADVLDGFDESLRRPVAIKRLRAEYADDADLRRRFAREARAGGRIAHPNVVAIYDVGDHDGAPFFVMERLPGRTLHDELAGGPVAKPRLRTLATEILGALGAAHRLGILHRDVKPANVLLDEQGHAKVADFGIAHVSDDAHHTSTGLVLGTMAYLPPERLAGGAASPAGDLYATGILLFEAATGRAAFRADSPLALARDVATKLPTFRPEDRRRLDPRFVVAVERAMAKEPADRFASADGMLAALVGADSPAPADPAPTLRARTTVPPTRRLPPGPTTAPASGGATRRSTVERPSRRRPLRLTVVAGIVLLALGVGTVMLLDGSGSPTGSGTTDTPSTSSPTGSTRGRFGHALDELDRAIDR